jgi:hypothetical protein
MHEKQYDVHELLLFNLWVRRLNIKVFSTLSLSQKIKGFKNLLIGRLLKIKDTLMTLKVVN